MVHGLGLYLLTVIPKLHHLTHSTGAAGTVAIQAEGKSAYLNGWMDTQVSPSCPLLEMSSVFDTLSMAFKK